MTNNEQARILDALGELASTARSIDARLRGLVEDAQAQTRAVNAVADLVRRIESRAEAGQ